MVSALRSMCVRFLWVFAAGYVLLGLGCSQQTNFEEETYVTPESARHQADRQYADSTGVLSTGNQEAAGTQQSGVNRSGEASNSTPHGRGPGQADENSTDDQGDDDTGQGDDTNDSGDGDPDPNPTQPAEEPTDERLPGKPPDVIPEPQPLPDPTEEAPVPEPEEAEPAVEPTQEQMPEYEPQDTPESEPQPEPVSEPEPQPELQPQTEPDESQGQPDAPTEAAEGSTGDSSQDQSNNDTSTASSQSGDAAETPEETPPDPVVDPEVELACSDVSKYQRIEITRTFKATNAGCRYNTIPLLEDGTPDLSSPIGNLGKRDGWITAVESRSFEINQPGKIMCGLGLKSEKQINRYDDEMIITAGSEVDGQDGVILLSSIDYSQYLPTAGGVARWVWRNVRNNRYVQSNGHPYCFGDKVVGQDGALISPDFPPGQCELPRTDTWGDTYVTMSDAGAQLLFSMIKSSWSDGVEEPVYLTMHITGDNDLDCRLDKDFTVTVVVDVVDSPTANGG